MAIRDDTGRRQYALPILFALAYLACAVIALELTSGADGIAAVWPASGVFVAGLILFAGMQRRVLVAGVALASLVANLWADASFLEALAYTVANLVEGGIVIGLLHLMMKPGQNFASPGAVAVFTVAALIASVVSAGAATLLAGKWSTTFFTSWSSTVLLGMLAVTPTILFIALDRDRRGKLVSIPAMWLFLATGGLTAFAFGQQDWPLLFLPMVALLFTTSILGLSGTAIGLLIIAAVGSIMIVTDRGVVSLFFPDVESQVLFFQSYLFSLVISVLPLAVLLARHSEDLQRLERANANLEAAERAARLGHWRFDIGAGMLTWSNEARRIAGLDVSGSHALEHMIAIFHAEDQPRVRRALDVALDVGLPFNFEARVARADGSLGQVQCRAEVEFNTGGDSVALFGTLREIGHAV